MTDSTTGVPPVLSLPLHRDSTEETRLVETRQLKDGRLALLAYTALDRLATLCGEDQPWLLTQTQTLDEIKKYQHFDVVIFDLEIPEQYRREGRIA